MSKVNDRIAALEALVESLKEELSSKRRAPIVRPEPKIDVCPKCGAEMTYTKLGFIYCGQGNGVCGRLVLRKERSKTFSNTYFYRRRFKLDGGYSPAFELEKVPEILYFVEFVGGEVTEQGYVHEQHS